MNDLLPLSLGSIGGEAGLVRIGGHTLDLSAARSVRDQLDAAIRAASGDTSADDALDAWLDFHLRDARPATWWVIGSKERARGMLAVVHGRPFLRVAPRTLAMLRRHSDGRRLVGALLSYRPGRFTVAETDATGIRVAVRAPERVAA